MNITFIKYNQVTNQLSVGIDDPARKDRRQENFSIDAAKTLIEKDDPSYSDTLKRIRKTLIEKGGMEWIMKEIHQYQLKQMEGKDE